MADQEKMPKNDPIHFGGSCACQRITYESRCFPTSVSACHCITCRKLSGAAYQCYADVESKKVTFYDKQEHLRYEGLPTDDRGGIVFVRFSKVGERAYCKKCYTPLAMRYKHQEHIIAMTLGSVDEERILDGKVREALRPSTHIFMSQNAWWCQPKDGLPQRERFGGDFEERMMAFEGKGG